jgi:hypothetical protein
MENWKDIPGYEELYQITPSGKVRSLNYYGHTGNIGELKSKLNKGYLKVYLYKCGKGKLLSVHVLLAITFLGHVPNGYKQVVDHKNNNSLDNRLENLQIITQRENSTKDKKRDLPTGVYRKGSKLRSWIFINGRKKYLGYYQTQEEASAAYQKALIEIN